VWWVRLSASWKKWSGISWVVVLKINQQQEESEMEKAARILGGVVLALIAIGAIANMRDIRRYVRISTM
jgi:hypothetical protein